MDWIIREPMEIELHHNKKERSFLPAQTMEASHLCHKEMNESSKEKSCISTAL
jgi:hypothetical protein